MWVLIVMMSLVMIVMLNVGVIVMMPLVMIVMLGVGVLVMMPLVMIVSGCHHGYDGTKVVVIIWFTATFSKRRKIGAL